MYARPLTHCIFWTVAAAVVFLPLVQGADVAFQETFDGPELGWQPRAGSEGQIVAQVRHSFDVEGRAASCETVTAVIQPGYSMYLEYLTEPAPVIEELELKTKVRSNRPGLQLAAEVVFPRATDPATQKPRRTVISGTRYVRSGEWQNLELSQVPLLVRRHARLLSSRSGESIDPAQAYVDRVILIVPGGAGQSRVDIDELTLAGAIFRDPNSSSPQNRPHNSENRPALELQGPLLDSPTGAGSSSEIPTVEVRRQGDALAIEGIPCLPRVIQHQGESFELLASLGFNTVWLDHVPVEEELEEARREKMWIICPPPPPEQLRAIQPNSVWQTVLAWSVGERRNGLHLDSVRALADTVRNNDEALTRPLIVHTEDRHRTYGRLAEVTVQSKRPHRGRIANGRGDGRPESLMGCVSWAAVATRLEGTAAGQLVAFSPRNPDITLYEPIALRDTVLAALAGGARGIVIQSSDNLGTRQPAIERLAHQISLLNHELALLEPWLVMGKEVHSVTVDGTDLVAPGWQLERARLVQVPPHDLPPPTARPAYGTLTAAGIPETASAHLVTTAGLVPLEVQRVSGGIRVTSGNLTAGGLVLLTDDARAVAQLKAHASKQADRIATVQRSLAMSELVRLEGILTQRAPGRQADGHQGVETLKASLRQCDLFLASRDYARGYLLASSLRRAIFLHGESLRQAGTPGQNRWESWPTNANVGSLPAHETLRQAVASLPRGANLLGGGDFEDLKTVKEAGWSHARTEETAWETQVEITSDSPRHGSGAVRLSSSLPLANAGVLEANRQPNVWITSPAVPLPPGAWIEISGWARVQSSDPGGELLVSDTLGGEELALRIPAVSNWEPFKLIRSVDDSGAVKLHLALTGSAQADVDAVMIRQIIPPQSSSTAAGQPPQRK